MAGVLVSGNTKATVSNSVVSGNGTGFLVANGTLGARACDVSNNTTGVQANAGGTIRLFSSMITANGTGLSLSGGTIISHISNVLQGNTTDGAPSSSVVLQ